jgi:hypothetical protein
MEGPAVPEAEIQDGPAVPAAEIQDGPAVPAAEIQDGPAAPAVAADVAPADEPGSWRGEQVPWWTAGGSMDAVDAESAGAPQLEPAPGPEAAATETPLVVGDPFRLWVAAYGQMLCGAPISPVLENDGGQVQYFENLALHAGADGTVSPLPIGHAGLRDATAVAPEPVMVDGYAVRNIAATLAQHSELRYQTRPLVQIRHLVIHHTGAAATLSPIEIALEHVETNGWPGIGYHFVIDARGAIDQTQDLTVETYHVRQFNPAAVGIALAGDYTSNVPPPHQLEALSLVLADLIRDLGLPLSSIRGHREMVQTPCPGDAFLTLWKPRLLRLVEANLTIA